MQDEDFREQLKTVNMIKLENIVEDQKKNNKIQTRKDKLIAKNNVYYKKMNNKEKIFLSEEFSFTIFKDIHEKLGHIGIRQMHQNISPYYTAENLTENIKKIRRDCLTCIKNKTRGQQKYGLMSQLGPATEPYQIISIDTIGGFGGSRSTKRYLHLLVDHFTRYPYIRTSKSQSEPDFIKLVDMVSETEEIGSILDDQYPGIDSKEFREYIEEKNIPIIFTSADSPFSNGLNEILNQTLVNIIRCKMNENKKKVAWTTVAQECVKIYNDREHSITGFAPSYLMYGKNSTTLPKELKITITGEDWAKDKITEFENSKKSHEYNKKVYDKNIK